MSGEDSAHISWSSVRSLWLNNFLDCLVFDSLAAEAVLRLYPHPLH